MPSLYCFPHLPMRGICRPEQTRGIRSVLPISVKLRNRAECIYLNLYDNLYLFRDDTVTERIPVTGRGKSQ